MLTKERYKLMSLFNTKLELETLHDMSETIEFCEVAIAAYKTLSAVERVAFLLWLINNFNDAEIMDAELFKTLELIERHYPFS